MYLVTSSAINSLFSSNLNTPSVEPAVLLGCYFQYIATSEPLALITKSILFLISVAIDAA